MGNDSSKHAFVSIRNPAELKPVETLSDIEIKMPRSALKIPKKEVQNTNQEPKSTNIIKHDLLDTSIKVAVNKPAALSNEFENDHEFYYTINQGVNFATDALRILSLKENNLGLCMESGIQLNISDILNAKNINEGARSELKNLWQRESKAQAAIDFFNLLYQSDEPNTKRTAIQQATHTDAPPNMLINETLSPIHTRQGEEFTNRRLFSEHSSNAHSEDYMLPIKKELPSVEQPRKEFHHEHNPEQIFRHSENDEKNEGPQELEIEEPKDVEKPQEVEEPQEVEGLQEGEELQAEQNHNEEEQHEEEEQTHEMKIMNEQKSRKSDNPTLENNIDLKPGVKGGRIFARMLELSQQNKSHYDPLKLQEKREAFALESKRQRVDDQNGEEDPYHNHHPRSIEYSERGSNKRQVNMKGELHSKDKGASLKNKGIANSKQKLAVPEDYYYHPQHNNENAQYIPKDRNQNQQSTNNTTTNTKRDKGAASVNSNSVPNEGKISRNTIQAIENKKFKSPEVGNTKNQEKTQGAAVRSKDASSKASSTKTGRNVPSNGKKVVNSNRLDESAYSNKSTKSTSPHQGRLNGTPAYDKALYATKTQHNLHQDPRTGKTIRVIPEQKEGTRRSPQLQSNNRQKYEPLNHSEVSSGAVGNFFNPQFLQTDSSHYQMHGERPNTVSDKFIPGYRPYQLTASNQVSQRTYSNTKVPQGNILTYLNVQHDPQSGNSHQDFRRNQRAENHNSNDRDHVLAESEQQKVLPERAYATQEQEIVSNDRRPDGQQSSYQPNTERSDHNQINLKRENQPRVKPQNQYIQQNNKKNQQQRKYPTEQNYEESDNDDHYDENDDDRYDYDDRDDQGESHAQEEYDDDDDDDDDDDYNQRSDGEPIKVRLDLSAFAKSLQKPQRVESKNDYRHPTFQPNTNQNYGAQRATNNPGLNKNSNASQIQYEPYKQENERHTPQSDRVNHMRKDIQQDDFYSKDGWQDLRKDQGKSKNYNDQKELDGRSYANRFRGPDDVQLEDDTNLIRKVQQDILLLSNRMNESLSPSYSKDFSEGLIRKPIEIKVGNLKANDEQKSPTQAAPKIETSAYRSQAMKGLTENIKKAINEGAVNEYRGDQRVLEDNDKMQQRNIINNINPPKTQKVLKNSKKNQGFKF